MGESRKDWIAARRIGARLGWFGLAPELDAEPLSLARPREFDTIVATQLPASASIASLMDQLAARGRLLIAVPFGEPYPSQLIAELRGSTVPVALELEEGELRLAVEKRRPTVASWQMIASPARLLALTERGASERESRRRAELDTLRAAYQRIAERAMSRAVDEAGPSIAASLRLKVLDDRVSDLAGRLKSAGESTDAQIGRALRLAITSPREAVRLPVRLLRARASSRRAAPALPAPSSVDRDLTGLLRRCPDRLALIVDGRDHAQASGLERELAGAGWGVVLGLGKDSSEMRAAQRIVRIEIDPLIDLFPQLERADAKERVAIFRTPHPIAARWINRLNAWGWTTIYDCIDDWPERLRLGQPHRYRRSVERFLVHNADLIATTELEAERLARLTQRAPRIIEDARRGEALTSLALALRTGELATKKLHARDPA